MLENNCIKNITLQNKDISLVELNTSHKQALLEAIKDGNLSNLWFTGVPNKDTIDEYIQKALKHKEKCLAYAFVVIENKTNKIIGSTRYCNIDTINRRLEIGYTWYSKSYQRTSINTQCKFLLLQFAFEKFEAIAVEFRTHWHNLKSRNAIARLGAKQDAVLRNHIIDKDGGYRDTVVFSIINHEWAIVKKSLLHKLEC